MGTRGWVFPGPSLSSGVLTRDTAEYIEEEGRTNPLGACGMR